MKIAATGGRPVLTRRSEAETWVLQAYDAAHQAPVRKAS